MQSGFVEHNFSLDDQEDTQEKLEAALQAEFSERLLSEYGNSTTHSEENQKLELKKFKCPYPNCGKSWNKYSQLGGHISRLHQGKSENYSKK